MMPIGQFIKRKRLAQGATLEQIAHGAGLDPSNLSRIEQGVQEPSSGLVVRIAASLGVTVGELYGDEPDGVNIITERHPVAYDKGTKSLLRQYRQLDAKHQKLLLGFASLLRQSQLDVVE